MAADGCRRVVLLPVVLSSLWPCIMVSAQSLASVEVFFKDRRVVSTLLQGEVIEGSWADHPQRDGDPRGAELRPGSVEGNLRVVQDDSVDLQDQSEASEPWIGVVPVQIGESEVSNGNQESFAAAVVNKMKRALVLGASALLILAFNQNTLREMDLSQVLSKPVVVIQTSENVTKLLGALLRGLRATAKITYRTLVQENLGATLTLWSSCGRSRGGLYGEWQGVICTGESNSQVQKYLQQLWDTVLLVATILCTGVIVQAHWQYRGQQGGDNLELLPKQDVLKRLAALKTRKYRPPRQRRDGGRGTETEDCAVCLEQFHNNQCLRVLPCLHEFHRDCVDTWLLLQHTCPLCKRSILGNFCKDS
ncbi:RING finger protein 215 [Brienomyrus brachyistius]|uniref:RING finger protein 215 n=1 Tax=Brienomyrus brachyistius TaxID=42636 RepID=UPI0020B1F45F|nr:RING finger protein 215 [Brienomyrus brachyistius]